MCTDKKNNGKTITKAEWETVLQIMVKYGRISGYVDFTEEHLLSELKFFDDDPKINDVGALKVNRGFVINAILGYPETTIPIEKWATHKSHCCEHDGCKYGDTDCPVVLKLVKQKTSCQDNNCPFKE